MELTCVQGGAHERLYGATTARFREALDTAVALALPELSKERRRPTRAWLNENRAGNYNGKHSHGSGFSGVYYVIVPGEERYDENAGANRSSEGCLAMCTRLLEEDTGGCGGHFSLIRPVAGMLLLFPSVLEHAVLPFYDAACNSDTHPAAPGPSRISVAFNI